MNIWFRMMNLNSFDCLLKFMKIVSNKRNWACHLTVDSSSVETNTYVVVFYGLFSKSSYVLRLATTCHSMHNENYRSFMIRLRSSQPVKWNMTSISEKDSFSFKWYLNLWRVEFINWLKIMIVQVRSWRIKWLRILYFERNQRPESSW